MHTRQAPDDATDDGRPRRARVGAPGPETGAEARPTARPERVVGLVAQVRPPLPASGVPLHVEAGHVERRVGAAGHAVQARKAVPSAMVGRMAKRLVPWPKGPTSGHVPPTPDASLRGFDRRDKFYQQ